MVYGIGSIGDKYTMDVTNLYKDEGNRETFKVYFEDKDDPSIFLAIDGMFDVVLQNQNMPRHIANICIDFARNNRESTIESIKEKMKTNEFK